MGSQFFICYHQFHIFQVMVMKSALLLFYFSVLKVYASFSMTHTALAKMNINLISILVSLLVF